MPNPKWVMSMVLIGSRNAVRLVMGCSPVNRAVVNGEEKHFGQEKSMQHFFSALGVGVIPIGAQSIPAISAVCIVGCGTGSFSQT